MLLRSMTRTKGSARSFSVLLAVLVASGSLAGCSASTPERSGAGESAWTSETAVNAARAEASEALPSATLKDWVTYSDFVVSGTVVGERRVEPAEAEIASSSVAIATRVVTVKINSTLWSAPGLRTGPDQISFPVGGWLIQEGKEDKPFVQDSAVTFVQGGEYLIPLTLEPTLSNSLVPLSGSAPVPFDDGVVGKGEEVFHGKEALLAEQRSSAWQRLWGLDSGEVTSVLRSVLPNPLRSQLGDATPLELALAVQKAQK